MNRDVGYFSSCFFCVPHTRGDEPTDPPHGHGRPRVFPTPVGMNRILFACITPKPCVPHTGGDEPADVVDPRFALIS